MRYYSMEKELIEIYNIRNIESIKVWDFLQNDSNKMLVVPGVMILYDGRKQLNLCAKDKYFSIFVKKVVEIYHEEKDHIVEDALTDPFRLHSKIEIDEYTKKILESGYLEKVNNICKFYQDRESYDKSLLFQIDEVKTIIKIVQYHIQKFFLSTDHVVVLNQEFSGYRDNYVMYGQIDGIEHYFPFRYEKIDDNNFSFEVSGLTNQLFPLKIIISFRKDEIYVAVSIDAYELKEESSYVINNKTVKAIQNVTRKGVNIGYKNIELQAVEENSWSNIVNMDEDANFSWYLLPWGAMYGIDNKIEEISPTEKVIEIQNMYLDILQNGFVKKEYYSKNYKRNQTASINAEDVVLDEVRKNVIGINIDKEGKLFIIETELDDGDIKASYLQGPYDGKYFYHGCFSEMGIQGIARENLVVLGKEQEIICNSDLVNKYKMQKLVRKGE